MPVDQTAVTGVLSPLSPPHPHPRYWNVLWSSFKAGEGSGTRQPHMEQGDLGVLRLLEALLETLPVLLLQAYTCVVMEANGLVSGECYVSGYKH